MLNKTTKPKIVQPKARNLSEAADNIKVIPYTIHTNRTQAEIDENPGFDFDKDTVVGVGPLKYKSLLQYENTYGEPIDNVVGRIVWVYLQQLAMINAIIQKVEYKDDEPKPMLEMDEFKNIKTPYGTLYGSLEKNVNEICSFIMSQYGCINSEAGHGEFTFEAIPQTVIEDLLSPKSLMEIQEDVGYPIFFEIFEAARLYNFDSMLTSIDEDKDPTEGLSEEEQIKKDAKPGRNSSKKKS